MAKRYGRSQRRAHRKEREVLQSSIDYYVRQIALNRQHAEFAREEAFKDFAHHQKMLEYAFKELGYALGRGLAMELNNHKEQIMSLLNIGTSAIELSLRPDLALSGAMEPLDVIQGEIRVKPVRYQQMVNLKRK